MKELYLTTSKLNTIQFNYKLYSNDLKHKMSVAPTV